MHNNNCFEKQPQPCIWAVVGLQNHGEPGLNEPILHCLREDFLQDDDDDCGPKCSQYFSCGVCDVFHGNDGDCNRLLDDSCWKTQSLLKGDE